MTRDRRKTQNGWYVTAIIDGGTANQRTSYLIGPFTGPRGWQAATKMVAAGSYAANRTDDPRFAFAAFGVIKLTIAADKTLPPGRLDLVKAVEHDAYRGLVITGGYPPL